MKKVLLIEDDGDIAELERDYLEADGFAVDVSSDGDEGMRLARTGDYCLILLDVMLPGADGFAICRAVRKERDVPILMVSARLEDVDKIRALGLGADDYIVKPFSPSELVARVKAHIARYERLKGDVQESIPALPSVRLKYSRRRIAYSSRGVRYVLLHARLNFFSSSRSTPRSYSARRHYMTASGVWMPSAVPPRCPFI